MDRGVIQQVDTPLNIYRRPMNKFVASFIGSPAMNFFTGQITSGMFVLGKETNQATKILIDGNVPDGAVTLGVRPEDFIVGNDSSNSGSRFASVTVDVVQHLGNETMAHVSLDGDQHVVRLPANANVRPGDRLAIAMRAGAGHLFSAADGSRLN
jgi:multiple sugar transport system ATP-binding protein